MFTDDKFGSVSRDKYHGIIIVLCVEGSSHQQPVMMGHVKYTCRHQVFHTFGIV